MKSLITSLGCVACVSLLSLLVGCPQGSTAGIWNNGSGGGTDDDDAQLSNDETAAINAALDSVESLTTSVGTTQGATEGEDSQASLNTTNTCPAVSFQASTQASIDSTLSLDFGDGCNALGSDDYFCSGSATGNFSATNSTIAVEFDALTCNNKSLNGSIDLSFDRMSSDVNVTGDWDLVFTVDAETLRTEGTGDATYFGEDAVTTFDAFDGSVRTHDGETYGFDLETVSTSYATYGNFIPFGGEMTLSGESIGSLTIRFDTSSPTTGDVQVSINGGSYLDYNLFDGM